MRQLHHAIVLAAAADADEVGYAYGEAVAEGAMSTRGCPSCERAHGTLRLLGRTHEALAMQRELKAELEAAGATDEYVDQELALLEQPAREG